MSTRIYTMTHKAFQAPADSMYIPFQVGKAGHPDLGYQGDDSGENISDLNCYYGELTGLYWLWQNLDFDGNIGVCHYRRYFIGENGRLLREEDYERILSEHDVITSKAIHIDVPYREYYGEAHCLQDLVLEGEVIRELYPQDYPVFEQVMAGNVHYFGNLMVTAKPLFDQYCEWLFSIFAELGGRIDVSSYDDYHKRVFGFLSEQLLMVWVRARGLNAYECPVGIVAEKAETTELKLAVGQMLKSGQVEEAANLFREVLKVRPDLELEQSDIRGELPKIELLLYICVLEKQQGLEGMLGVSRELPKLLAHLDSVREIQKKGGEKSAEDLEYLKQTGVTNVMLEVLARNAG